MITHFSEVLRKHAAELLGREDLKQLIDKVRETSPSLVDELIPNVLNMGGLHRILTLLLEEKDFAIRNSPWKCAISARSMDPFPREARSRCDGARPC